MEIICKTIFRLFLFRNARRKPLKEMGIFCHCFLFLVTIYI